MLVKPFKKISLHWKMTKLLPEEREEQRGPHPFSFSRRDGGQRGQENERTKD